MFARLKTMWESISNSLWFVPAVFILAAVLLAWLAVSIRIDRLDRGETVWWLHSGSPEQASSLLSSLLTSMVTMATLVISITMVVLTLAAGHLGPRLIRRFMADRFTQSILGFFLATIIYLVLVFRMLNNGTSEASTPHLAVTLGTALMVASIIALLIFVHHLARSIIADTLIERVGRDLDAAFVNMLPDAEKAAAKAEPSIPPLEHTTPLRLPNGGYVQAIDYRALAECLREIDAVMVLDFRPGHQLLAGGTHGQFCPGSALDDTVMKKMSNSIVLGSQRTAAQDVEFAIRQLVEVAVRALSPGVNDPFTAIAVIDRLGMSLALAMRRGPAQEIWCDEDGTARIVGKATTFDGILDAAFNQIRQAGGGHPDILIRMLGTLNQLAELARSVEHREALSTHVQLASAEGERSIAEPYDLRVVKAQAAAARARLASPD